jgi:AcrR family transcriptional regulator
MIRKTQAGRTAATRAALIAAARRLFAEAGYGAVGTEAIVREAGVSRGALYHQFGDKADLFAAVFEQVEAEVIDGLAAQAQEGLAQGGPERDPVEQMQTAAAGWLDACRDEAILRIALIDGPAVLGWARWREIGDCYGLALAQRLIAQAIAAGRIAPQPSEPLAYVLLGALRESALYIASADDQARARAEVGAVIAGLIGGLATVASD